MKRILMALLLAAGCCNVVWAAEINYFNKSWAEIRAKARAEHKYIFIDCYTDWCGWCKVMDKETMTDQGIVAFINDKFIAVKMDMEHDEGISIAMKYHINSFPTFMFFNENGEYVYQSMGYQKTKEFIIELNNALDKTRQISAPGFSSSINIDFPEIYKNIFAGNGKRKFAKEPEVTEYLNKQKDLFTEANWGVISECALSEKYTRFFIDNREKYKKLYGKNGVDDKISGILNSKLDKAIKDKSDKEFEDVLKMADKYDDDAASTKLYFKITYYQKTNNWIKCTKAVDDFIKQKGSDNTNLINSISWDMYEKCSDKKVLGQACVWMKLLVVEKDPQYACLDTYAALLYKTGQLKDAEEWALKAIETGKKAGSDVKSTEELLDKIKGKK